MKVICISGKAQHGKDTVASILEELLTDEGYSVLIAHYADLVKYVCKAFFGWDGVKDDYGRGLLQYVGTDIIRRQAPDYWAGFIRDMLRFFHDEWDYVLIPDCRFPNELTYLAEAGFDVTHLRVVRPGFKSPLTPEQKRHPSETALDGVIPDYVIENSGSTDELRAAVKEVVSGHAAVYQAGFHKKYERRCQMQENHVSLVLYSTDCPRCEILKSKLNSKHIRFTENHSVEEMEALGIESVPVLSVDGQLYGFKAAVDWVNEIV